MQFGDGLCNSHVAQELLDYLKQFDTDGKGALSEEELQEVMRGRIRRAWNSRKGWGRGDQRMPGSLLKSVCTSVKLRPVIEGATGHSGGASMQRLPNHTKQE